MDWASIVELFSTSQAWFALLMLTIMEVILGVDNIIFISIIANKLPEEKHAPARNIGLLLAMVLRIGLLFGITWVVAMTDPFWVVDFWNVHAAFTGQSVILIFGGLFLLYKSVSEIHHKLEGHNEENNDKASGATFGGVIMQIALINLVFSFDSILTAIGLTQDVARAGFDPLPIMILGVILSMILMMIFAGPIGRFIDKHPTFQILGLSFLILIAFMLLAEGAHVAHVEFADTKIGAIPKGYLYFAIAFALVVEIINMRVRRKGKPVQLRGAVEEAKERKLLDIEQ